MKGSPIKFIRSNHKRATKHMQQHIYHMFMLHRCFTEMVKQMGEAGFKQWMRVNVPEISWDDVQMIMDHMEKAPVSKELELLLQEGGK